MALILRTLACTYFAGYHLPPHVHPWATAHLCRERGDARARRRACCGSCRRPGRSGRRPGSSTKSGAKGDFAMRTLYLEPALAADLPQSSFALDVSPLLRELVLHAVSVGMLDDGDERPCRASPA